MKNNVEIFKGPKGDTGEQGPAGQDGKDGKNGINGIDGINGNPGPQGQLVQKAIQENKVSQAHQVLKEKRRPFHI